VNGSLMIVKPLDLVRAVESPDARRTVARAADKHFLAHCQAADGGFVSLVRTNRLVAVDVPKPYCAVEAAGQKPRPIRAESDTVHRAGVAGELAGLSNRRSCRGRRGRRVLDPFGGRLRWRRAVRGFVIRFQLDTLGSFRRRFLAAIKVEHEAAHGDER